MLKHHESPDGLATILIPWDGEPETISAANRESTSDEHIAPKNRASHAGRIREIFFERLPDYVLIRGVMQRVAGHGAESVRGSWPRSRTLSFRRSGDEAVSAEDRLQRSCAMKTPGPGTFGLPPSKRKR